MKNVIHLNVEHCSPNHIADIIYTGIKLGYEPKRYLDNILRFESDRMTNCIKFHLEIGKLCSDYDVKQSKIIVWKKLIRLWISGRYREENPC